MNAAVTQVLLVQLLAMLEHGCAILIDCLHISLGLWSLVWMEGLSWLTECKVHAVMCLLEGVNFSPRSFVRILRLIYGRCIALIKLTSRVHNRAHVHQFGGSVLQLQFVVSQANILG